MISEKRNFSPHPHTSALKQLREMLGISRKDLANILMVDTDSIGNWENSKTRPLFTIAQIKRFDAFLCSHGLSWQDIPDDVGDPSVPVPEYKRTRKKGN